MKPVFANMGASHLSWTMHCVRIQNKHRRKNPLIGASKSRNIDANSIHLCLWMGPKRMTVRITPCLHTDSDSQGIKK